jgi:hypothetical protein
MQCLLINIIVVFVTFFHYFLKNIFSFLLYDACQFSRSLKAGSLKMNTALEYSTRVVQEGGRRCKKSTLNDLVHLTPLRIPLMNPPLLGLYHENLQHTIRHAYIFYSAATRWLWMNCTGSGSIALVIVVPESHCVYKPVLKCQTILRYTNLYSRLQSSKANHEWLNCSFF